MSTGRFQGSDLGAHGRTMPPRGATKPKHKALWPRASYAKYGRDPNAGPDVFDVLYVG